MDKDTNSRSGDLEIDSKISLEPPSSSGMSSIGNAGEALVTKTVLRLKRRLDDSPTKVLVMSYKRRKSELETDSLSSEHQSESEDVSTVFCFAGTSSTDEVNHSVAKSILNAFDNVDQFNRKKGNFSSMNMKDQLKRTNVRTGDKTKEASKQMSKDSRFKVVSSKRGIREECDDGKFETPLFFNLLDLVTEEEIPTKSCTVVGTKQRDVPEVGSITVNGIPMIKEHPTSSTLIGHESNIEGTGFVYDIYIPREQLQGTYIGGQLVSVHGADEDYEFDVYREDSDSEIGGMNDDEDSNDEGNWRNDYPDSDPDKEPDEPEGYVYGYDPEDDDYSHNFSNVRIHGEDLSSDDDGGYIYSTENDGADDGVGGLYNRYKSRILQHEDGISDVVVSSASDSD